jgi:signal transduction histidine kinase
VVWNLLANAIKFTPRGGEIKVKLSSDDSQVVISISDTGEGIALEFLPHVFDRFRQADSSSSRKHGGLGIGLAIVRHLVELHGGTVKAESEGENCGATFTVSLPITPQLHPLQKQWHQRAERPALERRNENSAQRAVHSGG